MPLSTKLANTLTTEPMQQDPQTPVKAEHSARGLVYLKGYLAGTLLGLRLEPQQSWQRFLLGLVMFIAGLGLLLLLGGLHRAVYWLGTAVLCIGFAVSMTGYVGIFLQRFAGLRALKQKQIHFDD